MSSAMFQVARMQVLHGLWPDMDCSWMSLNGPSPLLPVLFLKPRSSHNTFLEKTFPGKNSPMKPSGHGAGTGSLSWSCQAFNQNRIGEEFCV